MNPQQPFAPTTRTDVEAASQPAPPSSPPKPNVKKNILIVLAVVLAVGLIGGLFFWQYRNNQDLKKQLNAAQAEVEKLQAQEKTEQPNTEAEAMTAVAKTYDPAVVATIDGFDKASDSLKKALVEDFYPTAKKDCDEYNANVSADARNTMVMTLRTMVRDDFAAVQFCGSGATSILVHTDNTWKIVGSKGMQPACSLVDQYKISKEITATCSADEAGTARTVTYP